MSPTTFFFNLFHFSLFSSCHPFFIAHLNPSAFPIYLRAEWNAAFAVAFILSLSPLKAKFVVQASKPNVDSRLSNPTNVRSSTALLLRLLRIR